jgi:hypothetical protein
MNQSSKQQQQKKKIPLCHLVSGFQRLWHGWARNSENVSIDQNCWKFAEIFNDKRVPFLLFSVPHVK